VSKKPVLPRALARRDVAAAFDRYRREAGRDAAPGFVDALEAACKAISDRPAAGSPRCAHELALPGLQMRRLKRHPYFVFCIEREEHIDVWRVLHAEQEIPAWMRETGDLTLSDCLCSARKRDSGGYLFTATVFLPYARSSSVRDQSRKLLVRGTAA